MARRYSGGNKSGGIAGNVTALITGIVILAIMLFVGNEVLSNVGTSIGNITGTPFYTGLSFLGMADTGGTWAATSIVGVLALVAVAGFVVRYVVGAFRKM